MISYTARINECRELILLTQNEFAKLIGVSKTAVIRWDTL